MIRFSEMWYWVLVVVVIILAASITILFGETNDVPVLEETSSSDTLKEADPVTEVELQPEDPVSRGTTVNVDPSTKVELRHRLTAYATCVNLFSDFTINCLYK